MEHMTVTPPARFERAHWLIEATPSSVSSARTLTGEMLREWQVPPATVADVVLAASELVTNVVMHAEAEVYGLELGYWGPGRIKVTVTDDNPNRCHVPRVAFGTDESGRGLKIVARLASCWGTAQSAGHKQIWALFYFDPYAPAVGVVEQKQGRAAPMPSQPPAVASTA